MDFTTKRYVWDIISIIGIFIFNSQVEIKIKFYAPISRLKLMNISDYNKSEIEYLLLWNIIEW